MKNEMNKALNKGRRMTFSCYWKTQHADSGEMGYLVESHDNRFIVPDRNSDSFREDAWIWRYAILAGKDHDCTERNRRRRIEVTGRVEEVRDNILILSDLDFEYKDTHPSEEDKNAGKTGMIDAGESN